MCIISMVYDEWNKRNWPWTIQTTGTSEFKLPYLSTEEIEKLRDMIAQFQTDKQKALELDASLGQPDCLDPTKKVLDEKVAVLEKQLNEPHHDLNSLRDEALRIAVEHGFTGATPGEDVALMHSELSELLEDIRNGLKLNETIYDANKKPVGPPTELADVIIRVLHFCGKHNIDIDQAVKEKMAYNETRPFRNGGKKL